MPTFIVKAEVVIRVQIDPGAKGPPDIAWEEADDFLKSLPKDVVFMGIAGSGETSPESHRILSVRRARWPIKEE